LGTPLADPLTLGIPPYDGGSSNNA
jgi:hypothetical protein